VLKLGNGAHLHPKKQQNKNQKKKRGGGAISPPLLRLGNGTHLRPLKKKPKKGKRRGVQVSLLSKLGHGVLKATKKNGKGRASSLSSSFFIESWL
jgi:hypothetical protein